MTSNIPYLLFIIFLLSSKPITSNELSDTHNSFQSTNLRPPNDNPNKDFSLSSIFILRIITVISIFFSIIFLYSYSKYEYNIYLILSLTFISLVLLNVIYVIFPKLILFQIALSFSKIEAISMMLLLSHGWYTIHFDSYYHIDTLFNVLLLFIIDIKVNCTFSSLIRIIINITELFLFYSLILALSLKTCQEISLISFQNDRNRLLYLRNKKQRIIILSILFSVSTYIYISFLIIGMLFNDSRFYSEKESLYSIVFIHSIIFIIGVLFFSINQSKNYSIDINMVRSYIENYHCRYINIYQAKKAKGFGLSIAESELICKTKNNIIVMLNPFNISIGKCEVTRNVNVN